MATRHLEQYPLYSQHPTVFGMLDARMLGGFPEAPAASLQPNWSYVHITPYGEVIAKVKVEESLNGHKIRPQRTTSTKIKEKIKKNINFRIL